MANAFQFLEVQRTDPGKIPPFVLNGDTAMDCVRSAGRQAAAAMLDYLEI